MLVSRFVRWRSHHDVGTGHSKGFASKLLVVGETEDNLPYAPRRENKRLTSLKGLNVCHFTLHTDQVVATVGCDLKLFSSAAPYQDPLGDNFAPPGFPEVTNCDSFLAARGGREGIMTDVSFISWGTTYPYVVSAVLVLKQDQNILPGTDTLLLQLAFSGQINETVVMGTFFIIGPGSVYWSAPVVCGQEKQTVVLATSPPPFTSPAASPNGTSGGMVAGIVIGVILLVALVLLVVFVAVRFCRRKKKVQYAFDGLDSDLQADFQAVARAALRGLFVSCVWSF